MQLHPEELLLGKPSELLLPSDVSGPHRLGGVQRVAHGSIHRAALRFESVRHDRRRASEGQLHCGTLRDVQGTGLRMQELVLEDAVLLHLSGELVVAVLQVYNASDQLGFDTTTA